MLTVKQVATRLRVSPQIIYELIASKKLPCYRIGVGRGTIRISEDDLEAYIATTKKEQLPALEESHHTFKHIDLPDTSTIRE